MTSQQEEMYREILIAPLRECALYTPKFGHSSSGGYSLEEFRQLYGSDVFYKWLGLDNPLMYSAHKAAGGITSIYRQIGIGCERLVRAIFMDCLGMSEDEVNWSYSVTGANGKARTLYLDGRIEMESIRNEEAKCRVAQWMNSVSDYLALSSKVKGAITGVVFEVRQGYKSKDSKRQNADIANASNAYANGYIPCLMVMSSQIDDDIVVRYRTAKWEILQGYTTGNTSTSTYQFFDKVIGFELATFMTKNQGFFQKEINDVLQQLMRA